jgi:hypothetical protein
VHDFGQILWGSGIEQVVDVVGHDAEGIEEHLAAIRLNEIEFPVLTANCDVVAVV